jgi:hypothetical protein
MEALSSKGDGTLTVVKEDSPTSFRVEQMVPTPARAKTLTLDTKTNQIFLIAAEYGPVPAAPAQTAPRPADRVHCFRRISALTLHGTPFGKVSLFKRSAVSRKRPTRHAAC